MYFHLAILILLAINLLIRFNFKHIIKSDIIQNFFGVSCIIIAFHIKTLLDEIFEHIGFTITDDKPTIVYWDRIEWGIRGSLSDIGLWSFIVGGTIAYWFFFFLIDKFKDKQRTDIGVLWIMVGATFILWLGEFLWCYIFYPSFENSFFILTIIALILKLFQFITAKFFYIAYRFHLSNIKNLKRWIINAEVNPKKIGYVSYYEQIIIEAKTDDEAKNFFKKYIQDKQIDKYNMNVVEVQLYNNMDFDFSLEALISYIPFNFLPKGDCAILGSIYKGLKLQEILP
ncbi:hypothetical protein H6P87_00756 [Rickettsia tillamookensis]|uniref:Uncharacterized protein n=1 Tax=Rickettsia tillamookensis TaxID=2761623 RepID=A0A9E6SQG9_9RICK|nr:hypothetical protein [Rickettsia tillamookensis]QQV75208.1 hypothetical protein H6P87_00756 [Rickettsia tillamookensis]